MITGDPINDDIQWLLQELKQVDKDLEAVNAYHSFTERGNTVSIRYAAIDEDVEIKAYLQKQLDVLNYARDNIVFELGCLDESYLDKR
jgi:hypothetical protein